MGSKTAAQILNLGFDFNKRAHRITTDTTHTWEGVTIDSAPQELYLMGTTSPFIIPINSAVAFNLTIGAKDQVNGDALVYSVKGGIKRSASGVVALILNSLVKDGAQDDPTWDINVLADDVNKSLKIEVIGDAGNAVTWKVTGIMAEVVID